MTHGMFVFPFTSLLCTRLHSKIRISHLSTPVLNPLSIAAPQISLNYNMINLLPPSIGDLHQLRMLRLAHNRLAALPPAIGGLVGLKGLFLDYNNLSRLPEEIGDLTALEDLNLEDNKIVKLPKS